MASAERMIQAHGVELCTEAFGDPADPAVLLIMGLGASMLWWEDEFCRMLAATGRFVIRYDHRDTGRSTVCEPGRPGYTADDLVADAAGVLDAYDVTAAHLVGVSAGGVIAQVLALDHPERVRSLVLISTTAATPGDGELPPPTEEFARFVAAAKVDWSQAESVIGYQVAYARLLAGTMRRFDEAAAGDLVRRDVARARDFSAAQNHTLVAGGGSAHGELSSITAPTLVIHGTADPLFPVEHGTALSAEIAHARLLTLHGAGHGIQPADWQPVVHAIAEHTAPSGR